jgi:SHS2 domain-containing protein
MLGESYQGLLDNNNSGSVFRRDFKNEKENDINENQYLNGKNNGTKFENEREEQEKEDSVEKRGYRYLDHMTDLIVEAHGETLTETFLNAAIGTLNSMFDVEKVEPKTRTKIVAQGHDLKSLLYDWIEKILLAIYIDKIVINHFEYLELCMLIKDYKGKRIKYQIVSTFKNNHQTQDKAEMNLILEEKKIDLELRGSVTYEIECVGWGESPDISKHNYKLEIKSVTYHEMEIDYDENTKKYRVKFLLDL